MIKAVIFDLNGVFIKSEYLSNRFEEKFGVKSDLFMPALKEVMDKIRLPNAGKAWQYWELYIKNWGLDITEQEFFNFWFAGEKEVPEMVEIAKQLKDKSIKVFILSNNFLERAEYYKENFKFLAELFEQVYYSWQTGFVKPNPEAFKKVLNDNNLEASEVVYFDDSEKNINVAKELGIISYLFEDSQDVEDILKDIDLL